MSIDIIYKDELLKAIFSSGNVGILISDLNGNFIECNETVLKYLGYSKKEILQISIFDITLAEDIHSAKQRFQNIFDRVIDSYSIERRYLKKDKSFFWAYASMYPVRDDTDKIIAILAIFTDITERKNAEEALRKNEEKYTFELKKQAEKELLENKNRLKLITDNAPVFISLIDINLTYLFVNKRYEDLHDLSSEDILGKKTYEIIGKEAYERSYPYIQRALKGESLSYENNIKNRHGKEALLEVSYTPYYENGIQTGIIILAQDITEWKKTELELAKNRRQLKIITDSVTDSISLVNLDLEYIFVNKRYEDRYGVSLENIVGKKTIDILGKTTYERAYPFIQKALDGEIVSFENTIIDKDKKEVIVDVTYSPYYEDGKQIGIIIQSQDITEKKKAQIALIESEKQLKDLNTTKDKFFSIIAHDLKNPFNSLLGLSKLLIDELDSYSKEEIKDILEIIHNSSDSAYKLLENLLEWSRAQTGKIKFKPDTLDLKRLIIEVVTLLRSQAIKKNIHISYKIIDSCIITADKNMITTVIRNLISNAIKFTKQKGEIIITVSIDDSNYEICIKDTGVGISNENLKKLFRIDSRYTSQGTENELGTGLGLILCKEFIEKHNGKIWAESELGKGSIFKITLPK